MTNGRVKDDEMGREYSTTGEKKKKKMMMTMMKKKKKKRMHWMHWIR
jgi:hypothetical protein